MAQKKIAVEFTTVETAHVVTALRRTQTEHEQEYGKENPAIKRAIAKLDAAATATPTEEKKDAEADSTDG